MGTSADQTWWRELDLLAIELVAMPLTRIANALSFAKRDVEVARRAAPTATTNLCASSYGALPESLTGSSLQSAGQSARVVPMGAPEIIGIVLGSLGTVLGGVGTWLSVRQAVRGSRPRLNVSADFITRATSRQVCFAVLVHNERERPIMVDRIEWQGEGFSAQYSVWEHADPTPTLPLRLDDNERGRVDFDPDVAATAIHDHGVREIVIYAVGGKKPFVIRLPPAVVDEAAELARMAIDQDIE